MKLVVVAALGSLVGGCAAVPPLPDATVSLAPANPQFGLMPVPAGGVVNYTHREPVDPQNWRELNRRLSPAEQGAGS